MMRFLAAFFLLLCLPALAGEKFLLRQPDGTLFRLEEGASGTLVWQKASPADLVSPEFQRPLGEQVTPGGRVRIVGGTAVEIWDGRAWQSTELRPPPPGMTYHRAHLDAEGNLSVELGGVGTGFVYRRKDGLVVVPNRMEWEGFPPPFKEVAISPQGKGLVGLGQDGSIWEIDPPVAEKRRSFVAKKIASPGTAEHFQPFESGSRLLLEGPGKKLLSLSGFGRGETPKVEDIPLPAGVTPGGYSLLASQIGLVDPLLAPRPPPTAPPPVVAPSLSSEAQAPSHKNRPLTPSVLEGEIALRRARVTEFRVLAKLAEERGLRVFLFGGTAAGFAHYVRWDVLRERGDSSYQKERFDYDYTSLYKSSQDLDIVITRADGSKESPHEIQEFQHLLEQYFPYMRGNHTQWEVRGLRTTNGTKEALLDNADFHNQHTDSNSTGLIELTDPPESESQGVVRDLRDWKSREPYFLKDITEGKLHYYYSSKHFSTARARRGENPEIISVIRYLTKCFQYGLKVDPEAMPHLRKIVQEFNPKAPMGHYASGWIQKNGKKLFQNALDIEYAWNTLEDLGLRRKLIQIKNDAGTTKSLAWWMSKEPLRTHDHAGAHRYKDSYWSAARPGKTAKDLGITVVAHETSDFEAYESIIASPQGHPKVFISRNGSSGEAAVWGDGFYTKKGEKGARGTGFHIRFAVDPAAREGVDFIRGSGGEYIIFKAANKLKVIPDSLMDAPAALKFISSPTNSDEAGLKEMLGRKLKIHTYTEPEKDEIGRMVKDAIRRLRRGGGERNREAASLLVNAFRLPIDSLTDALTTDELYTLHALATGVDDKMRVVKQLVKRARTPGDFIDILKEVGTHGKRGSAAGEQRFLDKFLMDFVRLSPTPEDVERLAETCSAKAAKEQIARLRFEIALARAVTKPEPMKEIDPYPIKEIDSLVRVLDKCLPLVKTAADFVRATRFISSEGTKKYKGSVETYLLKHWDEFLRLHPTDNQFSEVAAHILSSDGKILIAGRALSFLKGPDDLDQFVSYVKQSTEGAKNNVSEKFLLLHLDKILKLSPPPSIAQLKVLQASLIRNAPAHAEFVERAMALVKTPEEYEELLQLPKRPTKAQKEAMEEVVVTTVNHLVHLGPSIEKFKEIEESYLTKPSQKANFIRAGLSLVNQPSDLVAIMRFTGGGESGAKEYFQGQMEKVFLEKLDWYLANSPKLTLKGLAKLRRDWIVTKDGQAAFFVKALPAVKSASDFETLLEGAEDSLKNSAGKQIETFFLAHLDWYTKSTPPVSIEKLKALEGKWVRSREGHLKLCDHALPLVATAADFLKLIDAPYASGSERASYRLSAEPYALAHLADFLKFGPTVEEKVEFLRRFFNRAHFEKALELVAGQARTAEEFQRFLTASPAFADETNRYFAAHLDDYLKLGPSIPRFQEAMRRHGLLLEGDEVSYRRYLEKGWQLVKTALDYEALRFSDSRSKAVERVFLAQHFGDFLALGPAIAELKIAGQRLFTGRGTPEETRLYEMYLGHGLSVVKSAAEFLDLFDASGNFGVSTFRKFRKAVLADALPHFNSFDPTPEQKKALRKIEGNIVTRTASACWRLMKRLVGRY